MRYAQGLNAYADESEGQAALIIAWQCVVEVTFTRRCGLGPLCRPCNYMSLIDRLASPSSATQEDATW